MLWAEDYYCLVLLRAYIDSLSIGHGVIVDVCILSSWSILGSAFSLHINVLSGTQSHLRLRQCVARDYPEQAWCNRRWVQSLRFQRCIICDIPPRYGGGFIDVSWILYLHDTSWISPTFGRGIILVDDLYLVSKFHIVLTCISGISSSIWHKYPDHPYRISTEYIHSQLWLMLDIPAYTWDRAELGIGSGTIMIYIYIDLEFFSGEYMKIVKLYLWKSRWKYHVKLYCQSCGRGSSTCSYLCFKIFSRPGMALDFF